MCVVIIENVTCGFLRVFFLFILQSERDRSTLIRHIITSIINSETLYVECLNKMMQVSVSGSRTEYLYEFVFDLN